MTTLSWMRNVLRFKVLLKFKIRFLLPSESKPRQISRIAREATRALTTKVYNHSILILLTLGKTRRRIKEDTEPASNVKKWWNIRKFCITFYFKF